LKIHGWNEKVKESEMAGAWSNRKRSFDQTSQQFRGGKERL